MQGYRCRHTLGGVDASPCVGAEHDCVTGVLLSEPFDLRGRVAPGDQRGDQDVVALEGCPAELPS